MAESGRAPGRFALGPIVFEVDHRAPGPEGGPTLRVRRAAGGRELLRFDCFARGPHWHADPAGRDDITRLPAAVESLDHVLAMVRDDLGALLARAGADDLGVPEGAARAGVLDAVEAALRNPEPGFDDLDPALLRRRSGEKWSLYGDDVLPLWVADMDFAPAEPIRRRLQRALDLGELGYPMHPAPTPLPALFAERARERFGWTVDPRRVELLADVMQGVYVALEQLTEPGDGVVVQTPIYPPFLRAVESTGRKLLPNPLAPGPEGFALDADGLRRLAPNARMLLLSSPHNPTGRVLRPDELEAIAEIACAHDLVIVSDEIHADLLFSGQRHVPTATLGEEVEARTLTLASASKAFNIAGLRCSLAVFGSTELRRRFARTPRHVRGGMGALGIEATIAAWRHADPWLDRVRCYLEGNRDFLHDFLAREIPEIRSHPPESTYLSWLDCRALALEPSPYRFFLERAKVALSDGPAFGPEGEGHVRINFATSRAILTDALERMVQALRTR